MIKKITIFFSIILMVSCSSVKSSCIKPSMEQIELSWGEINTETMESKGYTLKSDLIIYESTLKGETPEKKYSEVDAEDFCNLVQNTRDIFVKVQTLHVPSKTSRYIVLNNKTTGVITMAIWNKLHNNTGNRLFKKLYTKFEETLEDSEKL